MTKTANDAAQFKIAMARYHLNKIPRATPRNDSGRIKLETNAEMFLFFSSSVIEIVKRQINSKFEIFDDKNVFYIHGIRKNLANSGIQKMVKCQIENYFTTPHHIGPRLDLTKSSLWRLQALRNQAMHGTVITPHNQAILLSYTVHDGKKSHAFMQKTKNPRRYFEQIFSSLLHFRAEISKIIE